MLARHPFDDKPPSGGLTAQRAGRHPAAGKCHLRSDIEAQRRVGPDIVAVHGHGYGFSH